MSKMERDEFITRVKAMDEEEIDIVLDNIPIEKLTNKLSIRVSNLVAFRNGFIKFINENCEIK